MPQFRTGGGVGYCLYRNDGEPVWATHTVGQGADSLRFRTVPGVMPSNQFIGWALADPIYQQSRLLAADKVSAAK